QGTNPRAYGRRRSRAGPAAHRADHRWNRCRRCGCRQQLGGITMASIQLLFSTTRHPFSGLIRAVTWSRWSHVALVSGSHVIEAVALEGVRQVAKSYAIQRASAYCLVDLPANNPEAIIDVARSQIGKPYDWTAIAGLG